LRITETALTEGLADPKKVAANSGLSMADYRENRSRLLRQKVSDAIAEKVTDTEEQVHVATSCGPWPPTPTPSAPLTAPIHLSVQLISGECDHHR
jgi:hypothetical protein